MASVTVPSLTRFEAVEDAVITDAAIDGTDHLILTKADGSTIDAGAIYTAVHIELDEDGVPYIVIA